MNLRAGNLISRMSASTSASLESDEGVGTEEGFFESPLRDVRAESGHTPFIPSAD